MKCIVFVVPLLIGLVGIGRAADPSLIKSTDIDVVALLPPPPARDSQEAVTELNLLLKMQGSRSDSEVARAKAENKLTPLAFQEVLGPEFTANDFPVTFALLEQAARESKQFSDAAKNAYARQRPYDADPRIQPAIEKETNTSYPSGHATRGILMARILCQIVPDKKDALLKRGEEIGWDRVLAGVHYPSDVYSGRVVGQAVANAMGRNADFQKRLTQAKAEFDNYRGMHPASVLEEAGAR